MLYVPGFHCAIEITFSTSSCLFRNRSFIYTLLVLLFFSLCIELWAIVCSIALEYTFIVIIRMESEECSTLSHSVHHEMCVCVCVVHYYNCYKILCKEKNKSQLPFGHFSVASHCFGKFVNNFISFFSIFFLLYRLLKVLGAKLAKFICCWKQVIQEKSHAITQCSLCPSDGEKKKTPFASIRTIV